MLKIERKANLEIERSLRARLIRKYRNIHIRNININNERYSENFHLRSLYLPRGLSFPGIRVNANSKFTQVSSVCKHGGWKRVDFIRKEIAERSRNIRMKIGIVIKIFSPGGGGGKRRIYSQVKLRAL